MKSLFILLFILTPLSVICQNKTDVSMFLKRDAKTQLDLVESKSGNLFSRLGHHGPAIENQWYALRIYFDKKTAIDLYSKAKPGLELKEKKWYPSKEDQRNGWGADYYKVGGTVGLGGVKLWDGEKIQNLHPVSKRSARVEKFEDRASMEMLSEGIPYLGKKIDVLLRVTVYSEKREAFIEAFSVTGEEIQFVTGINYFGNLKVVNNKDFILTWGIHPEDVAAEKVEVGAALFMDHKIVDFEMDDGKQYLFVTKAGTSCSWWISAANGREEESHSFDSFLDEIQQLTLLNNEK